MTDRQARIDELEAEVERLRREVARQRRLGRTSAQEALRLADRNRILQERLTAARDELTRLKERRSVRLALDVTRTMRRIRKGATRGRSGPVERQSPRPSHRAASEAEERRFITAAAARLAGVGSPLQSGPLVSIVMLNRDGAIHLRRVLPALAATSYSDVELVVIDNASTDDSLDVLEGFRPRFGVRVIRNEENTTFSDGNNQGVSAALGSLVLFLNNDVEPMAPDWLGWLVGTASEPGVSAVGARLIYPRRTSRPLAGAQFADLTLQHAGVGFRMIDGAPIPAAIGAGDDPLSDSAIGVRDVPALTAACLLVRRDDFEAVGGFDTGFVYGQEDVDLCLKLREHGGRIVYDGRSALWHHESSTRNLEDRDARMARTSANRDRLVGRWGPRLYRTVLTDALHGNGSWHTEPFRIASVGWPGPIAGAVERGWTVTAFEPSDDRGPRPDAIVVTTPGIDARDLPISSIRIAWITDETDPWLDGIGLADFDIIVVPDARAASLVDDRSGRTGSVIEGGPDGDRLMEVIDRWLAARRFGIRIGVPSRAISERWGDMHFARDVRRQLERAGFPTRIHIRPDWDSWSAARDDVGLHLLGRSAATRRSGRLEVLWHISHPDAASVETYEAHDLAFVASDSFAGWMDRRVAIPVRPLHQATDPRRFDPSMTGPHHELLFVANSRGVRRHIIEDILPTTHDLAVYGNSWTSARLDPRYLAGEHVPNRELGGYYAAADIVLNDHWPDMQREGFLSNRLYDASAAGAFVISDGIEGLEAEFDDGIVAYEDAADLRALIEHFLADPAARRARADRARAAVLARHTFERRVEEMLTVVRPMLEIRPAAFDPPVPQLVQR